MVGNIPISPLLETCSFVTDFHVVVAYQQCPECAKSYTANVWRASVQVRQKVLHVSRTPSKKASSPNDK